MHLEEKKDFACFHIMINMSLFIDHEFTRNKVNILVSIKFHHEKPGKYEAMKKGENIKNENLKAHERIHVDCYNISANKLFLNYSFLIKIRCIIANTGN